VKKRSGGGGGGGGGDEEHRSQNHLTKFNVDYEVGIQRDGETNVLVPLPEKNNLLFVTLWFTVPTD